MKKRAKNYFILADQYLETSKLLLNTLIENGNSNFGSGTSENEALEEAEKNALKSDSTLFIPAIFSCYQATELLIKGLLLLKNEEIKGTHEVNGLLIDLKTKYGDDSEVYKKIKDFYSVQIEIINKFKERNAITTTKELYESLRYPEDNNSNVQKKKFYNYLDLKYNGEVGIENFKLLSKKLQDIKEVVLKEYHSENIDNKSEARENIKYTKLTEEDYNLFYKSIVYGNIDDPIKVSIQSAYKDLCRTITGFSKNENHNIIFDKAINLLYKEINLLLCKNIVEQDEFDKWHKNCCDKLINVFKNQKFYYGQAQKWINMSLKNLSIIKHKLVEKQYEFFHIPIDNYIIKITEMKTSVSWSRLSNYDEYIDYQNKFRDTYSGIPLDNEFKLWLKAKRKNKQIHSII